MKQKIKLIGNDFDTEKIKKWYAEEEEWHNQFSNGRNGADDYWSIYEVFNRKYAIDKYAKLTEDSNVLSFGCAEGSDTAKLYKEFKFNLYGIEASDELINAFKNGFPIAEIVKATIEGDINFKSDFFDFIFCFGVLHHIPNVSYVLKEFQRVLKPGGIAIIREPVCWMYQTKIRPKELSPNERGIPVKFFKEEFEKLNFEILEIHKAYYKPIMSMMRKVSFISKFPNAVYQIDKVMSELNKKEKYYPENFADRFSASSAYYIIKKK